MGISLYSWRRSAFRSRQFSVPPPQTSSLLPWLLLSVGGNALLLLAAVGLFSDRLPFPVSPLSAKASETVPYEPTPPSQWMNPAVTALAENGTLAEGIVAEDILAKNNAEQSSTSPSRPGWAYRDWVDYLEEEAVAMAEQKPSDLSILLGDSISLWFPEMLLPPGSSWLNQGISGEGVDGLLKRVDLFDDTEPQVIYVMIGINDLLRDMDDEELLDKQESLVETLTESHPDATVVVQAILPHSAEKSTWEGRDRLLDIPNDRIRQLNQALAAIAKEADAEYLDLQPVFSDADGNLRTDLSTDGLHLNDNGYRVWASAIQLHRNIVLAENSVDP